MVRIWFNMAFIGLYVLQGVQKWQMRLGLYRQFELFQCQLKCYSSAKIKDQMDEVH